MRMTGRHVLAPAAITSLFALALACAPLDEPKDGESAEAAEGVDAVTTETISNAADTPENWLSYGGGYDEQRHSLLTQINKETIADLKPAWTYQMRRDRGVEATPLVVDGVMYLTGAWSLVYALDAKTGEELWVHDPEVPGATGVIACCDVINRGVALYEGKVFFGTLDGRLQALDAETGELLWSTVTVDQTKPYTITGAPRTAKGLVFIGNGGAEIGVRGYVSAYDVNTGDLVWRFYTAPNPNKEPDNAASDEIFSSLANKTWGEDGEWTSFGGGGTVWDSIVYDDVNDSLIIGVGNGSPWNAKLRDPNSDGDNLFLSSMVALNPSTGAYKWHFQTTPRENWDYTATQTIILADLPLGEGGALRRVAMQAPKNGFFYVVDAATGEFIHGAPYIPLNWAQGLDENGRPIENPAARQTETMQMIIPSTHGGHNWHPMAFSPQTNFAYIPAHYQPMPFRDRPEGLPPLGLSRMGYDPSVFGALEYDQSLLDQLQTNARSFLLAWDTVNNKPAWSVPSKVSDKSGVLSTEAGLVFQGDISGAFRAFDAASGDVVWESNLKYGLIAAPSTYEVDGEQYVVAAAGPGGAWNLAFGPMHKEPTLRAPGHVIAYKLGGAAEIPEPAQGVDPTPKAEVFGDKALAELGQSNYAALCAGCHGLLAIAGGATPDLRWSYAAADKTAWEQIVLGGALVNTGMVPFADFLTPDESEAIRAYVLRQAHLGLKLREASANSNE